MAKKDLRYITLANSVLVQHLTYPNGQDGEAVVADTVEFKVDDVPAKYAVGESEVSLVAYGLSQLLQDRASSVQGAENKLEKMKETFARLQEGEWKAQRESTGGERKPNIPADFAQAFARFYTEKGRAMDAVQATAILQGRTAEERKAIRENEQIKALIAQVRAESNSAAMDFDLDGLI